MLGYEHIHNGRALIARKRVHITVSNREAEALGGKGGLDHVDTPRRRHVSSRPFGPHERDLRTGVAQQVAASTAAGTGDKRDRGRSRRTAGSGGRRGL